MKSFKKVLSLVMALVMSLTLWMPATALPARESNTGRTIMSIDDYAQHLYDEGYPVYTTQQFAKVVRVLNKIISLITGKEKQTFNLTMDGFLSDISAYVCENSGLDMDMILTNLPDITVPARLVNETFEMDTEAFRAQMYKKRDEYNAQGDALMGWIHHFLGLYLSIIELCEVYSEQTSNPVIYEVLIRFTFKDGGQEVLQVRYVQSSTRVCCDHEMHGTTLLPADASKLRSYVVVRHHCLPCRATHKKEHPSQDGSKGHK